MFVMLLWIVIIVLAAIVPLLSMRTALAVFLIGTLIFPSLWLGEEVALRFEIVYCLWLVFVFFLQKSTSKFTFRWHPVLSRYSFFLLIIALSTMFSLPTGFSEDSLAQLLISFYGMFRPLLVMFLFMNIPLDEKFVRRILWGFIYLSIPIDILSFGQTIGLDIAQKITLQGYTSPSRTPVFSLLEEQGRITRSTGVFESPVFNAIYFLMVLVTIGFFLVGGEYKSFHKWILYFSLGLALIAGITTLSSTFLLGLVVIIVLFIVFLLPRYQRRFLRVAIRTTFIIILFVVLFLPYFLKQPHFLGSLSYQFQRILLGNILETRYNPETGILANTYHAIAQRPIIGWGLIQLEDVFVGDSLYMNILYESGALGFLLFLWAIWTILKQNWRFSKNTGVYSKINMLCFLWTLLSLATSVGAGGAFMTLRLQEWYWAIVGISLNTYLAKANSDLEKVS